MTVRHVIEDSPNELKEHDMHAKPLAGFISSNPRYAKAAAR
jgi:hypothetical protein